MEKKNDGGTLSLRFMKQKLPFFRLKKIEKIKSVQPEIWNYLSNEMTL